MDILGIGGWELMTILILMLIVAGPKRMLQWAYILGQHVSKLRGTWAEVMGMVQKEVDAAGLDVKVSTHIPTRQSLNHTVSSAFNQFTQPLQQPVEQLRADIDPRRKAPAEAQPAPVEPPTPYGTWSQPEEHVR